MNEKQIRETLKTVCQKIDSVVEAMGRGAKKVALPAAFGAALACNIGPAYGAPDPEGQVADYLSGRVAGKNASSWLLDLELVSPTFYAIEYYRADGTLARDLKRTEEASWCRQERTYAMVQDYGLSADRFALTQVDLDEACGFSPGQATYLWLETQDEHTFYFFSWDPNSNVPDFSEPNSHFTAHRCNWGNTTADTSASNCEFESPRWGTSGIDDAPDPPEE